MMLMVVETTGVMICGGYDSDCGDSSSDHDDGGGGGGGGCSSGHFDSDLDNDNEEIMMVILFSQGRATLIFKRFTRL